MKEIITVSGNEIFFGSKTVAYFVLGLPPTLYDRINDCLILGDEDAISKELDVYGDAEYERGCKDTRREMQREIDDLNEKLDSRV